MRVVGFNRGFGAPEPFPQILVAIDSLFVSTVGKLKGIYGQFERFLVAVGSHALSPSKIRNTVVFPPGIYEYRS
ncbi:hypothetical protein D3C80_1651880 [compost metagenome]